MKKNFSALGQMWFILKFTGKFLWDTDKKSLVIAIVLNMFFAAAIVPIIILDKLFLDVLIANISFPNPSEAFRKLLMIVGARFGIQLLRSMGQKFSSYFGRFIYWRQSQRLEVMIGQKYATIPVPTIEDPDFKDRYQRIERESLNRMQRVTDNFLKMPQYMTGVISSLSIFVIAQPFVAVLSLLSLIPSIFVERVYIKKDYELDSKILLKHRLRGLYYFFLSRGRSYMELRLLNIHTYLGKKITEIWNEVIALRGKLIGERRTWAYVAGILDDAVSYSLDAFFGFQVIMNQISVGTAQAYVRAISNFKSSVGLATTSFLELYENYLYLQDLVWFLNLESPYFEKVGKPFPKVIKNGIKFDHVWFKYPQSENWILQDISFEIKAKQNIALVGENGSGKTTLVKLLSGFYEPTQGSITIDGVLVSEFNKPSYWKNFSVLFQDFDNYSITARESIVVSNISDIDNLEKVRKFAKMADIDDWVESLPLKYDNSLSRDFKHGVTPSTGQYQRIGIARTLFKESQIIVLDEPTSNVDPQAEEDIFNQILKLGKEKILVFISHRFSTVRRADKILLLGDGKITEEGTHDELIKKQGEYSRLFELQAKSYQ